MPLAGFQDKIVSAISEDGVNFEVEEGYRYYKPGSLVVDPDVFQFKGKWYMIIGPVLTLLESEDGLTFKEVEELPFGNAVSCTIPFEEGLRIYFHSQEPEGFKIYLSYTEDLENWTSPEPVLCGEPDSLDQYGTADPAVVKLPQNGYFMAYKTWINPPPWTEEIQAVAEEAKTITGSCIIEEPGVYVLSSDITSSETCITVKADDVTVDGKNYVLKGKEKEDVEKNGGGEIYGYLRRKRGKPNYKKLEANKLDGWHLPKKRERRKA
jgi:hypothetical protein